MAGERSFVDSLKIIAESSSSCLKTEIESQFCKLQEEFSKNLETLEEFHLVEKMDASQRVLNEAGFFANLVLDTPPKLLKVDGKIPTIVGNSDYNLSLEWDIDDRDEKRNKLCVKISKDKIIIGGNREPLLIENFDVSSLEEKNLDSSLFANFIYQADYSCNQD